MTPLRVWVAWGAFALGGLVAAEGRAADLGQQCAASTDCTGPQCASSANGCFCFGTCQERLANGEACEPQTGDESCASGFCAQPEMTCCETACLSECGDCSSGTCVAVTVACTLPSGEPGYCDNFQCVPPKPLGSPCSQGIECEVVPLGPNNVVGTFCADGVCCDQGCGAQCDSCTAAGKGEGVDGVCGVALECASSSATCDGDHTVTGADGGSQDCSPFKCNIDGSCKITCTATADCIEGTVCDTSFANPVCVPSSKDTAAADDEGGCGCRVLRSGRENDPGALFVVVLLSLLLRRRRS